MDLKNSYAALEELRRVLISYIYVKARAEDWHGLADVAMDLREVDAKLEIINGRKEDEHN